MVVGPGAYRGLSRVVHLENIAKEFNSGTNRLYSFRTFNKADQIFGQSDSGTIEPEMFDMAEACIRFLKDTQFLWFK